MRPAGNVSLRDGVLAAVASEAGTAADVARRLDAVLGSWWGVNDGQVLTVLNNAEAEGLVKAKRGSSRQKTRVWEITRVGRDHLRAWMRSDTNVVSSEGVTSVRSQLYLKLLLGADLGLVPIEDLLVDVEQKLAATRRAVREISDLLDNESENTQTALAGVLAHLEAELHWLVGLRERWEAHASEVEDAQARP